MSENLDLVRSIFADWERGEYSSAEWAHPEIEYVIADGPDPGHWTGLDGMAQGWRTWLSAWRNHQVRAEDLRELDHGRVLALSEQTGGGRASGLEIGEIKTQGAAVFHVCDGKVTRFVIYLDRDRALADLGLEE